MAETATVPEAEQAPGGKKKLLLIGGVVGALVLAAAAWFLFLAPSGEEGAEPEGPLFSEESGEILPVDETTVSLGGSEPHFAMVTYSAVLAADADAALVEAELPRLRSRAQAVFRTFEAEVLDTPEGFEQLQDALSAVATELWPDGEVHEVLVEALLVQ